ncbi:membrane protein [Microbispora sp. ATCC PTA-5024]|uniref:membrane protein n=1 Tax=Microbispora sp. ATCC PTA-5024 TaxID=316330 RepID=UPI0003DD46F7|nr:membrane protein [Microbispora sp. ATCC PTA-5024]ETK35341.1 membrane protein [Microbispora sp. ATCC PTA-5024]
MTTVTDMNATRTAVALRNLYVVRFGFALVWAVLLLLTGPASGPLGTALLVIYPLFDVAAAIVDLRSSKTARPAAALYVNTALSLLTAIGLAVTATSGVPAVLRVWGAWAITAGIVQLIVAISRRGLGGQWAMILSGGLSTIAGTAFILQAGTPAASLTSLAGYAIVGGVFFLISALRLHRTTKSA